MVLSLKEEISRLVGRGQDLLREQGVKRALARGFDKAWVYSSHPFQKARLNGRTFLLASKEYPYFCHPYNATWRNERAVEVALAQVFLAEHGNKEILEIGNVLRYYFAHNHVVVDKYEKAPGVENVDIIEFERSPGFDAIVSLSTLEHVGWDETPRQPERLLYAIQKIRSLLKPEGHLLLTVPLGYNAFLDGLISRKKSGFPLVRYLKRISADNEWREVSLGKVVASKYNSPYRAANAIAVILH